MAATGADTSVIYVPAAGAPDAILEACDAGIGTIFCITEGIPALDMLKVVPVVEAAGARLIGPNCPGATSPGRAKVGIIPGSIHREGRVGLVSRSGTLTYEVVQAMTDAGIGQSTCVGIGGDPIHGLTFRDVLALFREDPETDAIVLIGEIGGAEEEEAAAYAAEHLQGRPMVAFIAGRTAPRRQAHGPCRGHHLGRHGHGGGQGRRARGGRHPRRRLADRDPGAAARGGGRVTLDRRSARATIDILRSMDERDQRHLRQAIELARLARGAGNHPFGALVVAADGTHAGRGRQQRRRRMGRPATPSSTRSGPLGTSTRRR